MSRPIAKFRQFAANCYEFLIMALAILTIAFVTVHVVFGADAQQKSFSSPEEGVRALIDAGKKMTQKRFSKFSVPRLNPLSKPATRFPIGKPANASINLTMRQTSW